MSYNSVVSDRKIASKRVHVERVIGLLKHPLNTTESSDVLTCDEDLTQHEAEYKQEPIPDVNTGVYQVSI